MAINIKDETLQLALKEAGIISLPRGMSSASDKIWISAIVLTKRINGQESYAYALNDGSGKPVIKADFGPYLAISQILSIHPVESVEKRFQPDLRSDKQIVTFLSKNGYNPVEIEALLDKKTHDTPESIRSDRAKVKSYVTKVAITLAKQTLMEEKRVKDIKNYNSRIQLDERK